MKWQFKEARRKRLAAVEDANAARRAAKNALFLEAEVARLTRLLGEAGVDPQPRGTEISLRREVARLRKAVARAKVQADAELRKALRRSRRQKTALNALTKENARLRRTAKASQGRVGTLEAELSKLRATAAVLSGTLYGRRSEKQQTPRCGRRRGQRSGAPGHGRTPRPGIEERVEVHAPPAEARVCAACGKSYAANGADESSLLEIEVRAHRRVIRRGRWRRRCGRCCRRPTRWRRSVRSPCGRSSATPARASSGTSSSPATTTSATPPWSAPRCAMPCTPTTARRSPCSASPPAAWTLAPRDNFIGWSRPMREKNLPLVVDNPRFLILPWVHIPNLGSHILARVRQRLPGDWTARYGNNPVLIETFVETPRYTGAVYRASGWIRVGPDPRARALRHQEPLRQTKKGHLAPAPAQGLEAHPQSVESATVTTRPNAYFWRAIYAEIRGSGCSGNRSLS